MSESNFESVRKIRKRCGEDGKKFDDEWLRTEKNALRLDRMSDFWDFLQSKLNSVNQEKFDIDSDKQFPPL